MIKLGLWNKISKPIPNILLKSGLVILFLSPLDWETRWVGMDLKIAYSIKLLVEF